MGGFLMSGGLGTYIMCTIPRRHHDRTIIPHLKQALLSRKGYFLGLSFLWPLPSRLRPRHTMETAHSWGPLGAVKERSDPTKMLPVLRLPSTNTTSVVRGCHCKSQTPVRGESKRGVSSLKTLVRYLLGTILSDLKRCRGALGTFHEEARKTTAKDCKVRKEETGRICE
ncbi:hypothetical protein ACMFMG_010873 [Clarireedia jacksonii]